MSDELNALQETATQARATADELKNALTDDSSKKERATALDAEADAVEAEAAYADAKAKAEADAAAQAEAGTNPDASRTGFAAPGLKAGDACVCPDGRPGTVQSFTVGLICLPNQG